MSAGITAPNEDNDGIELPPSPTITRHREDADGITTRPPELTTRAVLLGLAVGCLIAFTNLYLGLQSGWISMMSIQSALIGRLLGAFFRRPFSAEENVVLQTTAVATGTMPLAAGFVGIIPALSLLNEEQDGSSPVKFSWTTGITWSFGIAFFGVFLAVPLRKQTIIKEKLPFPSGTATAQLISVLYKKPLRVDEKAEPIRPLSPIAEDREALLANEDRAESVEVPFAEDVERVEASGWTPLVWSFSVAAFITVLAYFFPFVFALPLFGTYLAREWLWYFTPSLSYVGTRCASLSTNSRAKPLLGIIMGFPTTVSMNLGMFVGWAILSPIAKLNGWAPGPVGDMAIGARGWILWVALAIMTADSVTSILPVIGELASLFKKREMVNTDRARKQAAAGEVEPPSRLIPRDWVLFGLSMSTLGGVVIVWVVLGYEEIRLWATVLGFGLGGILSLLGVRALGETDLNPVSGLGKISQFVFALIQPGKVAANIIAGGIAEAGAQHGGSDAGFSRLGHLVGASPRAQFHGQLIGSFVSIFVTTTAFSFYSRAYTIPGPEFPAPTAYVWLNLARLLRSNSLPPHVGTFMIIFIIPAVIAAGAKVLGMRSGHHPRWMKWIPSGVAFSIGMLNTPNFSMARLVGGIIELWWRKRQVSRHHVEGAGVSEGELGESDANGRADGGLGEIAIVIIASGFVIGEGVASILNLILKIVGVDHASCWGCMEGICGGGCS